MKTCRPVLATKEWMENNVLAGNGEVRECQRRTKSWAVAKRAESVPGSGAVRKVFRAESGLHAVVLSGRVPASKYEAAGYARDYADELDVQDGVEIGSVVVSLFTCDAATGVWHALVLFKRGAK